MPKPISEIVEECHRILDEEWSSLTQERIAESKAALPVEIVAAIDRSINSSTMTYRYVLPTQLLAKVADPSVDTRALQVVSGVAGAFDARSVCHEVLVPFDQRHELVLGGSDSPYLSNPVRVPMVDAATRHSKRDKAGWDLLCFVLDYFESEVPAELALKGLRSVLAAIAFRLQTTRVVYPVPRRLSIDQTLALIGTFLSGSSGGDRAMAISGSLLRVVGSRFNLFAEVRRGVVNASDRSSGQTADIECIDPQGNIVLSAEVKDTALTLTSVQSKLPAVREAGISEFFFLLQKGVKASDASGIELIRSKEFASGQNLYLVPIEEFARYVLALMGETGRREFLATVGVELDTYRSAFEHRKVWASLLASV